MKRKVEYFRHYIDCVDSIITENCIEPLVFDGLSVNGCKDLDELAISLEDDFKETCNKIKLEEDTFKELNLCNKQELDEIKDLTNEIDKASGITIKRADKVILDDFKKDSTGELEYISDAEKKTHQDVLDRVCTHNEYYSQFVTDNHKRIVKDMSLSDPLVKWDNLPPLSNEVCLRLQEAGDLHSMSIATKVSLYKQAKENSLKEFKI